ncbi:MAG: FG-GAP repeat protein [Phycisphaerales bacterium]|nr:FG-GAP repeat protein [Phycisphaerales bacterium]
MRRYFVFAFLAAPAAAQVTAVNPPAAQGAGDFGRAVAAVADVNADGFGDVVVGAPGEHAPTKPNTSGRAYVMSGATGALIKVLSTPNAEVGGQFGWSVSGIPDVNGDGRGDVIVGAPHEDPGASAADCGRAYIFSGATGVLLKPLAGPGQHANAQFGWAVAGMPDVNGDGRGDVAIAANFDNLSGLPGLSGVVYLYSGASGAYLRALRSPVPAESAQFGWSVGWVPDADGDGRPEVIVGAAFDGPLSTPYCGRAYLFSASTGRYLRKFQSPAQIGLGLFGFSVCGVRDVDGDGRGDVVIGAPGDSPGASPLGTGRAYVYSGKTGVLLRKLVPPAAEANGKFGAAVAPLADVNADGRGDVIVGMPGVNPGGAANDSGQVYVYSGATGVRLRTIAPPSPQVSGRFGASVAGVKTFGGTAVDDLIVGTDSEQGAGKPAGSGRIHLIRY